MPAEKILIVEDDPVSALAYRGCLQKAGYEVDVVRDGQAGLAWLEKSAPDGLLLDLMMPNMGGIELLKKVRALPHLGKIPIFVYTNAFIPQMVQEAKKAGATDVFEKAALTPQILITALQKALEQGA